MIGTYSTPTNLQEHCCRCGRRITFDMQTRWVGTDGQICCDCDPVDFFQKKPQWVLIADTTNSLEKDDRPDYSKELRLHAMQGHYISGKDKNRMIFDKHKMEPLKTARIERNSPCPCGSGKNVKKCCGAEK